MAVVGLLDRLRPSRNFGIGANAATPKQAEKALAAALRRQLARGDAADPVDIQLLGQVTAAADWPKVLAYWQQRNPGGTRAWPGRLDVGSYALNLWPLAAGRVSFAPQLAVDVRHRQPKKLVAVPGLTVFADGTSEARTALAVVTASWIDDVALSDFEAVRLAPPILETWTSRGRLEKREAIDFGLAWSLPAAEGV